MLKISFLKTHFLYFPPNPLVTFLSTLESFEGFVIYSQNSEISVFRTRVSAAGVQVVGRDLHPALPTKTSDLGSETLEKERERGWEELTSFSAELNAREKYKAESRA